MRYLYLTLLLTANLLAAAQTVAPKYLPNIVPKNMSVKEKKARFYALVVPAVQKVHKELLGEYKQIAEDIQNGTNVEKIEALKATYKVKTDTELLGALKPHPQSIVIAQAAMESSWATSRFFVEANNIFGIWSFHKNEPRIAASGQRKGKKTIWLKKFTSVEEGVRAYFNVMAKGRAFKEFRALRVQTNDPYKLVKKLDRYSEIGAAYGKELRHVIKFNRLVKYDK